MGMKIVDEEEFQDFQKECQEAEKDIMKRDQNLEKIYDKFERDLTLLGATAVEDRLQDDVPETIADLQKAGIKIWMLTGDKLETAENIAFSCQLFTQEMMIYRLSSVEDVKKICTESMAKQNS